MSSQRKREKMKSIHRLILSAYRGADESWRLARLAEVAERLHQRGVLADVVRLHDRKGMLSVVWESVPDLKAFEAVKSAWVDQGECENNVRHAVADEELPEGLPTIDPDGGFWFLKERDLVRWALTRLAERPSRAWSQPMEF